VIDLASHYSRFRVADRILLTGHSHQAWPDVAFDAQQRAWLDAAELVDRKWERAADVADEVRAGWRRLLNDPQGTIALGQNTHELVVRLLSALLPMFGAASAFARATTDKEAAPSLRRIKLVTTDGEFHTIRRQLDRIAEEGVDVVKTATRPVDTLAERLAEGVDDRTACVLVSSVLFETAEIVPNLGALAEACLRHGATLLIDAYHHLNVVPFDVHAMGLTSAFVTGGGYKYCQLGEGNCFLRIPPDAELRPAITGWFSEFATLAEARRAGEVRYGEGAARFAGATYDPTSHYRAASVFAFHRDMRLTPDALREISRYQVGRLREAFSALDLDPAVARIEPMPEERRGGFLAIRSPRAGELVRALGRRGVWADARGDVLRLGPAPYVRDQQLDDGIAALRQSL
jgi:kynureninase